MWPGGPSKLGARRLHQGTGQGAGWDVLTCRAPDLCTVVTGPQLAAQALLQWLPPCKGDFIHRMCRGQPETRVEQPGGDLSKPLTLYSPGPSAAERGWREGRAEWGAPPAEPEQMGRNCLSGPVTPSLSLTRTHMCYTSVFCQTYPAQGGAGTERVGSSDFQHPNAA